MSVEAIQVTYELDKLDRRIGYIAVHPPVSESLVQEFGETTTRLLSYEIVERTGESKVLKLTIGNHGDRAPMEQSQLFSVAYGFCNDAELAGYDLDLVKGDEYGVEPSVNGSEILHFGSASR